MRTRFRISACIIGVVLLTSCSGSSGGSDSAVSEYADFCALNTKIEEASVASHSADPAAISDPTKMKTSWSAITEAALTMRDSSPAVIKDDVALMVESIVQMNEVFKANGYDLFAMSKDEKLRQQLDAITSDTKTVNASQRFNSFMQKNCVGPESSAS